MQSLSAAGCARIGFAAVSAAASHRDFSRNGTNAGLQNWHRLPYQHSLAKAPPPRDQPSDGLIQLDGKDIRHLAANELRATFGVVPQETVLFAGTLYDNLVMAHPHASFEDVIAACKAAEIHEVIEKLPGGYQTEIGERGTGLSGGQKQRIAIARALLKKPKILIFDEAVSNLDTQTAEHFAKTINKLKGEVTMLFITHQIPRGLQVDEVFGFGEEGHMTRMGVVEDEG